MTDMKALKDVIKLLADVEKHVVAKDSPMAYIALAPDLFPLFMEIGDVPAEIGAMVPADYLALAQELVVDLGVSEGKIGAIIAKAFVFLNVIVMQLLPAGSDLVATVKASK